MGRYAVKGKITLLASVAFAGVACPTTLFAQEVEAGVDARASAAPVDGEIIVMAQKRNERAQDVPISLTVISEEQLEQANISNVLDLVKVTPSFTARRQGQASNTTMTIRGIGSGGNSAVEPSVGAYVDGVYIARPGPLLGSLNDVSSVEVLRGPQGTLFGRNASVGAVSFRTTTPGDEFSGQIQGSAGSFNHYTLSGRVNLPLAETVAARVSMLYDTSDGFGRSVLTGERVGGLKTIAVRSAFRFDITPNLEWVVRGDFQRLTGDGNAVITVVEDSVTPTFAANLARNLNGEVPILDNTGTRSLRQLTDGRLIDRHYGGSSDLKFEFGDGYSVRLLSAARKWTNDQVDRGTPLVPRDLFGRKAGFSSSSHSEELQFLTPVDRPLSAVMGLYYFRERYTIGTSTFFGDDYCNIFIRNTRPALLAGCLAGPQDLASDSEFNQLTKSYAAYGQATYKITPEWEVTSGLRWTRDEKSATLMSANYNSAAALFNVPDNADMVFKGSKLTYRLSTNYKPTPDVMLFATYATGYKSGGFDDGTGAALGSAQRIYRPELVKDYEIGIKSQWLDRKLTANLTLFRMDISDFQLRSYNGSAFSVRNAGSIRQEGAEFELSVRPAEGLTLGVSGTRLRSKYTDFQNAPNLPGLGGTQDFTGRSSGAPKWSGSANMSYQRDISADWGLNFSSNLQFTSRTNVGSARDLNPDGYQQGYGLLGARLALFSIDEKLEFAVSGDNLTDQRYCISINSQVFGGLLGVVSNGKGMVRCVLGETRSFKVSARMKF